MLTYHDTLPGDLKPLLVLDASGRVRQTYRFIETHRGDLQRLRPAEKDYSPLAVHIWQRSGGKGGWEKKDKTSAETIDAIAETIRQRPHEKWLVVAHLPSRKTIDVGATLRGLLPKTAQVETITWGRHLAVNDFDDVPNVILAGTLFYPPSYYIALTHLAQDRDVSTGAAPKTDVRKTEQGEYAHLILQAVCRGRVRKSEGHKCHQMNAYIIASARSGIPSLVETIFPGCSVHEWRSTERRVSPSVIRALKFIDRCSARGETEVTATQIRAYLDLDAGNFRKRVLNDDRWQEGLKARSWASYDGRGRRPGGVRKASSLNTVVGSHRLIGREEVTRQTAAEGVLGGT